MEKFNNYQKNCNLQQLKQLFLEKGQRKRYSKKEFYIRQQQISRLAGWVESGTFQYTFEDEEGVEHIVGYAFENEFVCDYSSFIQAKAAKVNIMALTDCVVYEITLSELIEYWENDFEKLKTGKKVAENLYELAYDRFLDTYSSPMVRYQRLMSRCPTLQEKVSLKSIASFLGVTPETVSHIRKKIYLSKEP